MSKAKRITGKKLAAQRARNFKACLRAIRESNRRTGTKNSAADVDMAYRLEGGLHDDAMRRATETPEQTQARVVAGIKELIRVFGKPFAQEMVLKGLSRNRDPEVKALVADFIKRGKKALKGGDRD